MALYSGNNQVKKIYVGTQEIKQLYLDNTLVFSSKTLRPLTHCMEATWQDAKDAGFTGIRCKGVAQPQEAVSIIVSVSTNRLGELSCGWGSWIHDFVHGEYEYTITIDQIVSTFAYTGVTYDSKCGVFIETLPDEDGTAFVDWY